MIIQCPCGLKHEIEPSKPGKWTVFTCHIPFYMFKGCKRVHAIRIDIIGNVTHEITEPVEMKFNPNV